MKHKAPRGTRDILPGEVERWQALEQKFGYYCSLYGFAELRFPVFENTELFARSVGEDTDIVSKEMYNFTDRSGRQLTLRPEGTAAAVRAYLEHNMQNEPQPVKLYYQGPMFRYDRPQAGRYRQFHQFGLELFGASQPAADAEIISLSYSFLKSFLKEQFALELNSVGCPVCRPRYREKLHSYLEPLAGDLCPDCRRRFKTNPMRVLDCKVQGCRNIVQDIPEPAGHLCPGCQDHFTGVRQILDRLEIPYRLNPRMVRGLDYYTRTAFEFVAQGDNAGASVGGGGRYDNLVECCGGPATPGVGVAFGIERLLLAADEEKLVPGVLQPVFVAFAGEEFEIEAFSLAAELRRSTIPAEVELLGRSLKAQLKHAGRKGYRHVAILGGRELEENRVTLRDMESGCQELLSREELWLKIKAGCDSRDSGNYGDVQTSSGELPVVSLKNRRGEDPLYRDEGCGELRKEDGGRTVNLAGWVQRRRDHGGLIFIDLRDRTGHVQLVFDSNGGNELFAKAESLRGEYVIRVRGEVVLRTPENINSSLPTGEIEVQVEEMDILNSSLTPPFYIEDDLNVDENLRLRYRYLDLRRPEMFRRLAMRHRGTRLIRDYLDRCGFLEVETPVLTRSTPEGARDYLVPSRVQGGSFFALPQSPQLFKQLLMVAGFERYFQIARCFRDEDLRADRQPEFTQVDIEASFFGMDNMFKLLEGMMSLLWSELKGKVPALPFPRMPYREAMDRFGSDKPDLRFGMEIRDCAGLAAESDFKVFRSALESGGAVKGLKVSGGGRASRKELDDLTELAAGHGARGLAWMVREDEKWRSPIAKFFTAGQLENLAEDFQVKPGDLLLFVAGPWELSCHVLGQLRLHLAPRELPEEPNFLWVVDFPLLDYSEEEKRYTSRHHPFTAPREEDLPFLENDPAAVRAQAYDLVLNGVEIGGGSNRIYREDIQSKIFNLLGLSPEESREKFGFLLEAFAYGAPPHGGIALGLDRIISLLTGDDSIRQVIPFPKTAAASCLMTGAPTGVDKKQLDELRIAVKPPGKSNEQCPDRKKQDVKNEKT